MSSAVTSPLSPWTEIPDSHWRAYFGKNADYYLVQVKRLQVGKWPSFHFEAFLIGFIWMLYRRMYVLTFCAFMIILAESTLEEGLLWFLDAGPSVRQDTGLVGKFLTGLIVGTLANRMYLWDARRSIRMEMARSAIQVEEILLERIRERGGTSWFFLVILLALVVIALVIANVMDVASSF